MGTACLEINPGGVHPGGVHPGEHPRPLSDFGTPVCLLMWDDGIIDPRDTRIVLAISLSVAYSAPVRGTTSWGVFRH